MMGVATAKSRRGWAGVGRAVNAAAMARRLDWLHTTLLMTMRRSAELPCDSKSYCSGNGSVPGVAAISVNGQR